MYLKHLQNPLSVENDVQNVHVGSGSTEHRMCQLFMEELWSVNRISNSKFVGESPASTLSVIAAGGTHNQVHLFNQICSMVEFRVQNDPKLVTAQDKMDGLAEELNEDDLLQNFMDQREMMLDPIRYAQHLNGGEIKIQIEKEAVFDTKKDENETASHKKTETQNINPGWTPDLKD